MKVFELVIIYFALGTPFGVYHAATHSGEAFISTLGAVALNVFFWPLYGIFLAFVGIRKAAFSAPIRELDTIEGLRNRIEDLAFENKRAEAIFEFRATISRYVGLCEAVDRCVDTGAIDELAATGLIANKATAAACVARRNRKKLDLHQTEARMDLISAIDAICAHRPEIVSLAVHLARLLNDHIAAEQLDAHALSRPTTAEQESTPVSLAA